MYEMLSKQSSLFEWLGNDPLSICLSLCLRIHLFKFLFYINFLYVWISCLHVRLCSICMPGACTAEKQKRHGITWTWS